MSETDHAPEIVDDEVRPRRPSAPRLAPRTPRPVKGRKARIDGLLASAAHAFEQRQFFILLPYAAILGVVASLETDAAPMPWALALVALGNGLALWLLRRAVAALRVAGLFAAFWVGFSLLSLHGALFGTPMLHGAAYGQYEARVDAVLAVTPNGRRLVISGILADAPTDPVNFHRARIEVKDAPPLAPGDIIDGKIYFYEVPGPAAPGGFDAEFSSYFQGIGAYGSARSVGLVSTGNASAPDRVIDGIRQTIGARIGAVLGQPANGIARAIITGDQTAVLEGPRKLMATAGLAHVMAISGLHLSLVAGSAFFVLRLLLALVTPLARYVSAKKAAAGGAIVTALVYYAISGGGAAALRSTVMAVLIFAAVLVGRRALSMRNVAIAGLFTVLTEPSEIFRPSFQLSFAAVVALVGIYEMLQRPRFGGRGLLGTAARHFGGIALTSLVAGTGTLVFAIYHFQQTAPLGIVGNLMVMPLVTIVMMPSAMLAVLSMPFGFDRPFIWLMGWSIDRMLDCAGLVSQWSQGINWTPLLTPLALVIALLALAWFSFFTNRYRLIGPVLAIPAIMGFAVDRPPDVVISDTTQAVAVNGPNGLTLISGKPGSFSVDIWGETYRQSIGPAPPGMTACDSLGCVSRSPLGFSVAVGKDMAAFEDDCADSDLVVTRLQAPAYCRTETTVIDAGDLARGGTESLNWDKAAGRFTVRPAIVDLNRPWRAGRQ
jgi:competence protein ComEC